MAVLSTACTGLQGLQGGGAHDAGLDALTDALADAPVDAPSDGTPDAASEAAGPFCASLSPQPTFCEDFDEGTTLSAGWNPTTTNGGTYAVDSTLALSPPNALLVTVPAVDAGTTAGASISRPFTLNFNEATVDLDFYPEQSGASGVFSVYLTGGYVAIVGIDPSKSHLQEGSPADAGMDTFTVTHLAPIPLGAWTHLAMTLHLLPKPAWITVSYDGVVQLNQHPLAAMPAGIASGTPTLKVGGLSTGNDPSGWKAHWDNVVFDLK
jgi:hypothetical protein